ncbi:MAG: hypothetical protein U1B83_08855, partial [Candidatus Cloacimonadaceae bacterium]|nr:hypothetical protein [Candidatus Cloacimonadaceae bacterium]
MYEFLIQAPDTLSWLSQTPLWLHPEFLGSVAEFHDAEARQVLCFKGSQLFAAMPIYEKKTLGQKRLINPVSSYYQGLFFNWEAEMAPNRRLLDALQISGALAKFLLGHYRKMQINLTPDLFDVRGFVWNGLKAKPLYTFVHDLALPFQPLRDEREKLNRAAKMDYEFTEEYAPEPFLEMLQAMHSRKNHHSDLDYARLEKHLDQLHQAGLMRQYNLKAESGIVSANILLHNGEGTAYTVRRATDAMHLKNGASSWHSKCLIEALGGEFDRLDFCGANDPEVGRFKAALG